jgi:O-antigen/teichoic acid export membrane protein
MVTSKLRGRVLTGFFWTYCESWGAQLSTFILFLILTRLLKPEDFGIYASASALMYLPQILITQGLGDALIQRAEITVRHINTTYFLQIFAGLMLALIGYSGRHLVANWMNLPALVDLLPWLGLSYFFHFTSTIHESLLRKNLSFRPLAIRKLTGNSVGAVVAIVCALNGAGLWSLVINNLVAGLISALMLWHYSSQRPLPIFHYSAFRDLAPYGLSMSSNNVLLFLSNKLNQLLIGVFLGPVILGYYSIAERIYSMLFEALIGTTTRVIFPAFSKMQDDKKRLANAFIQSCFLTHAGATLLFICISSFAFVITPFFFGPTWSPSSPILLLMALGGLAQTTQTYNSLLIRSCGKIHWVTRLQLVQIVIRYAFFFYALPLGILGITATQSLLPVFLLPITIGLVSRLIPLKSRDYWRALTPSLIAACFTFSAQHLIWGFLQKKELSVGPSLGIASLSGVMIYVFLYFFLAPDQIRTIRQILQVLILKARSSLTKRDPTNGPA